MRIEQRHGTAADWQSVNPVLLDGEFGVDDDTQSYKIGDGETRWNDLPFASSGGSGSGANWNDLPGKPVVVAAGSTQADARAAIDAASTDDLAAKANEVALVNGLNLKANESDLTTGLAAKANQSDLTAGLALKADVTTVSALSGALQGKANSADVAAGLALKADVTAMTAALALKAAQADLTAGLAAKANATDLTAAVSTLTGDLTAKESIANKGVAGGYVPLDSTVKIPATFIPGSVDDILEFPTEADFPQPGLAGKLYVAIGPPSTTWRWSGTQYTEIAASPGTTDDVPEGHSNLYYTDARVESVMNIPLSEVNFAVQDAQAAITTLQTDVAAKVDAADKGAPSGFAPLGSDSIVPAENLPAAITSTDQLAEGSSNQYFTDERAQDAMAPSMLQVEEEISTANGAIGDLQTAHVAIEAALTGLGESVGAKVDANDPRLTLAATAVQPQAMVADLDALQHKLMVSAQPLDEQSPVIVTPAITLLGAVHNSAIDGGAASYSLANDQQRALFTYIGGPQILPDRLNPLAYCFQWRLAAGNSATTPVINGGAPFPKSWSVQFDMFGANEFEFIVWDYGGTYNLTLDSRRVWAISQTTNVGGTAAVPVPVAIKLTLADSGFHRVRFDMSNMSLEKVSTSESGSILTRPIFSPRAYFLGDAITQGVADGATNEGASWIYKFSQMCGIYDTWNDAWNGWGPVTGQVASLQNRTGPAVAAAAPDLVFVQGFQADLALTPATVGTAFGVALAAAKAADSRPVVFGIGSFDLKVGTTSANPQPYTDISLQCRVAAGHAGVAYIEPSSGSVYDANGNTILAGTGPWFVAGDRGNLIDQNQTLTSLGHLHYAYRVYQAVRLLLDQQ